MDSFPETCNDPKDDPPIRAILGEPTFHTVAYKLCERFT